MGAMGRLLAVVQKGDGSLGFYEPLSGTERDRIELDPFPHELALSTDRRHAYISHFGLALAEDHGPGGNTVSVVDLSRRARLPSLHCGEHRRPHGIACDDHHRLYVLSEANSQLLIATRPESGEFDRALPTAGEGSHLVTVNAAGSQAFSSNMGSNTVSAVFPLEVRRDPVVLPVGARPEGSTLDGAEAILYVTNRESAEISRIDVSRLEVLEPIRTRPGPVRICWDDRGRLLVPLYHDASLALIDPSAPQEQIHVTLPAKPISVSCDRSTAWAFVSTLDDEVCVIDLEQRSLLNRIKTRAGPDPAVLVESEIQD